ncbi:MAG: TolC family protein [Candidatus Zixiibacteriota bacterium]|nr:MAG: TolC family protein [candidate division Zixibacteria bacterium]
MLGIIASNTFRLAAALLLTLLAASAARPLTLEQALSLGRERSLQLQGPRLDRERIDGQVREAWSNALPQVEGLAAYQHYFKPAKVFFPDPMSGAIIPLELQQDNNAVGEVTLNQPLFTFGRISSGLKAAYAARQSNQHQQSHTERWVDLEISRRFWTVLLLRDVVEARRASLAVSDSNLARVQRMRRQGLMSDYDVLRVQVQAGNQVPPLRQAENDLRLAELALREYLGVPLDTALTAQGQLTDYAMALETDAAPARLQVRDDLEALRDLSAMYEQIYHIYRSQRWPVLSGQIKYAWQWSNDAWDVSPQNNVSSVYAGVALSIPLWNSGRVSGQAQQYRADWRRAEWNLQQAERGARLQYESAESSYRTALASERAAERAVAQAGEARAIAQVSLAQGLITTLEMDAAQLDELVARVNLAQARYSRLVAAAEARMALGLSPYSLP